MKIKESIKNHILSIKLFEKPVELIRKLIIKNRDNSYIKTIKRFKRKNKNGVFLVLTPGHGNLGDQAIAIAELKMLDDIGINYFEITFGELMKLNDMNKIGLMNGMPIIVHGGGFLGTIWYGVENTFRSLILNNPNSVIFCFPNTIYYGSDEKSQKRFEESKNIYNAHKNLFLCAREKISFEIMKNAYENVRLIPDMVFSLNKSEKDLNRDGCIICLRSDIERTLMPEEQEEIINQVKSIFDENYSFSDVHLGRSIKISMREIELESKLDEFRKAQLVITDRLHGMIFAAITGTPCIVVNSKSHKIKGCYDWIKNLEYIRFADNIEEITSIYYDIPKKTYKYDNSHLLYYYDELKSDLLKVLKK